MHFLKEKIFNVFLLILLSIQEGIFNAKKKTTFCGLFLFSLIRGRFTKSIIYFLVFLMVFPLNCTPVLAQEEGSISSYSSISASETSSEEGNNVSPTGQKTEQKVELIKEATATGAFTYEYPISVPPGRNGFEPDLKLTYNSQDKSNENLFGYGWTINIPYIERINRFGVNFLYNHNLFLSSLSGELSEISDGKYGAKFENGEFLSYEFSGDVWNAKDKKGNTYTFGYDASSRQDDPERSDRIFKWMISKITDKNGNYIEYEYYKQEGQIYISKIIYTVHARTEGAFSVIFTYENRSGSSAHYKTGFSVTTSLRIKTIETQVQGQWARRYELQYQKGSNDTRSMLESIIESGRDNLGNISTLPITNFEYEQKYIGLTESAGYIPPAEFFLFPSSRNNGVRLADINGDGLVDFLHYTHEMTNRQGDVYLNTGSKWELDPSFSLPMPFNLYHDGASTHLVDVNGDGLTDVLVSEVIGHYPFREDRKVWINKGASPDTLINVTHSKGAKTSITYQSSAKYKDENAELSNPKLPFIIQTVKKIETDNGFGNKSSVEYHYKDGYFWHDNVLERQFTGFGVITKTDQDSVIKTYNSQGNGTNSAIGEYDDDISKAGFSYREEVYDNKNNLFSTSVHKIESFSLGTERKFIASTGSTYLLYNGNSDHKDTAESKTYNIMNGNLIKSVNFGEVFARDNGSFSDKGNDSITTVITYANKTSGSSEFPSSETLYDYYGKKIADTRIFYDNLGFGYVNIGNTTKQEKWLNIGNSYIPISTKTFNQYGLVLSDTDALGNTTHYNYDSFNLYPTTVTNPLGHITLKEYNYASGKDTKTIDPNGVIESVIYDGLGRIVSTQSSGQDGQLVVIETREYNDDSFPTQVHILEYISKDVNPKETYEYYDGLGRLVQSRTKTQNNEWSTRTIKYDNKGRIYKEYLPIFQNQSSYNLINQTDSQATEYNYDVLSRITSTATSLGTSSTVYEDWVKTVTDANGHNKKYYYDAFERLIKVDELNGSGIYSTFYEYDTFGNLTRITDAEGNVRFFVYDSLGRQILNELPHKPNTQPARYIFMYDKVGNKIMNIYPDISIVFWEYDALGRVLFENYNKTKEKEVIYEYDTAVNGIGKIARVISSDVTVEYKYDKKGNIESEIRTIQDAVEKNNTDTKFSAVPALDGNGIIIGEIGSTGRVLGSTPKTIQFNRKYIDPVVFALPLSYYNFSPRDVRITEVTPFGFTLHVDDLSFQNRTGRAESVDYIVLEKGAWKLSNGAYLEVGSKDVSGSIGSKIQENWDEVSFENLFADTPVILAQVQTNNDSSFVSVRQRYLGTGGFLVAMEEEDSSQEPHKTETVGWIAIDQGKGDWGGFKYEAANTGRSVQSAWKMISFSQDFSSGPPIFLASIASCYDQDSAHLRNLKNILQDRAYVIIEEDKTLDSEVRHSAEIVNWIAIQKSESTEQLGADSEEVGFLRAESGYLGSGYESSELKIDYQDAELKTNYQYDDFGSLQSILYPDGSKVLYNYNEIGKIQSVAKNNELIVQDVQYGPHEKAEIIKYANGVIQNLQYDANKQYRLVNKTASNNGVVLQDISYTYDPVGNILNIKDSGTALPKDAYYSYDDLNRLINSNIVLSGETVNESYTYSPVGNILSKTGVGNYQYNYSKFPYAVTRAGSNSYSYDTKGNLITELRGGEIFKYEYDYLNRLSSASTSNGISYYVYGEDYNRLQKQLPSGERLSYFGKYGEINEKGKYTNYIFADSRRIVTEDINGLFYNIDDHLSSASILTDSGGLISQKLDYLPFGSERVNEQTGNFATRHTYTDQESDEETGMLYYGARYYNSDLGRFTQVDPILLLVGQEEQFKKRANRSLEFYLSDPQNLNTYSYVLNNPIRYTDPDGEIVPLLFGYASIYAAPAIVTASAAAAAMLSSYYYGSAMGHLMEGNNYAAQQSFAAVQSSFLVVIVGGEIGLHVDSLFNTVSSSKKVPNPNGKLGGPAHQAVIKNGISELNTKGYNDISFEIKINLSNGNKRFADFGGYNPQTNQLELFQVGKVLQDGVTPISRERAAIADIMQAKPQAKVQFLPYNK